MNKNSQFNRSDYKKKNISEIQKNKKLSQIKLENKMILKK